MDNLLTWCLARMAPGRKAFQTPCGVVGKASHEALGQKEAKGGICGGFTSRWLFSKAAAPRLCWGSAPSAINEEEAQHPESNPSSFSSAAHRVVTATNMLSSKPNIWQVAAHP